MDQRQHCPPQITWRRHCHSASETRARQHNLLAGLRRAAHCFSGFPRGAIWGSQEPLTFFSGISVWPTEMVRLVALMLAIFFMFKASFDLRANARQIETEFSFAPLRWTPFRWRDLGIGLEHWQMKEPARTSRFSAEEAWHTYLCRNKFWPRFIRIGILFTLYFFAFTIFQLFSATARPRSRRDRFLIDKLFFFLAAVGLMLLSFYVVDAIQLNSNFIRMFGREVTKWSIASSSDLTATRR